jgi:hypothetical protein
MTADSRDRHCVFHEVMQKNAAWRRRAQKHQPR